MKEYSNMKNVKWSEFLMEDKSDYFFLELAGPRPTVEFAVETHCGTNSGSRCEVELVLLTYPAFQEFQSNGNHKHNLGSLVLAAQGLVQFSLPEPNLYYIILQATPHFSS